MLGKRRRGREAGLTVHPGLKDVLSDGQIRRDCQTSRLSNDCQDGIFSSRTAAQQLIVGEYRRRLVRRHKLMFMAANAVVSSVSHSQVNSPAALAAKRGAPSMGGVAMKGPASVLSRLNTDQHLGKAVLIGPDTDQSLAVIKLEEAKYASICGSVLANKEQFKDAGIFDLGLFFARQCPSGALLALVGGGGLREGGQRQR
jgi:hypothetical protein